MNDDTNDARPVPLPPAVHDLIRQVAPEKPMEAGEERTIVVDGKEWVARPAGGGVAGTGELGGAYLVAIRFHPVATAGSTRRNGAVRETLIPRGRFENLYDEELVELFHRARPVAR